MEDLVCDLLGIIASPLAWQLGPDHLLRTTIIEFCPVVTLTAHCMEGTNVIQGQGLFCSAFSVQWHSKPFSHLIPRPRWCLIGRIPTNMATTFPAPPGPALPSEDPPQSQYECSTVTVQMVMVTQSGRQPLQQHTVNICDCPQASGSTSHSASLG